MSPEKYRPNDFLHLSISVHQLQSQQYNFNLLYDEVNVPMFR